MDERKPDHGPKRRRVRGIGLAVVYYGIVGLIGLAMAVLSLLSLVESDPYLGGESVFGPIVASVVALALLPTAWRLRRDPPQIGPLVGVGVIVGLVVGVVPLALILWAWISTTTRRVRSNSYLSPGRSCGRSSAP